MKYILLLFISIFLSLEVISQNAPVTTVGSYYGRSLTMTIPVTVTNFQDIGAISLTLTYDPLVVTPSTITFNSALPGFSANWTSTPGMIIMGWYGMAGVSLPNNAHLAEITFTGFVSGITDLSWVDNGTSCEYAKYDNGAYTILNDLPTPSYYKNGRITYQRSGPITVAPVITNAVANQALCIPITVYQFRDIGAISLTLDYDPAVLTFQSINSATVPATWLFYGQAVTPGRLIAGGYGPGIDSIPDGGTLFNACFMYNGGSTSLAWYDAYSTNCEYADAPTLQPLYDIPQSTYYLDGAVNGGLVTDFMADNCSPVRNAQVNFTDLSTGNPTSWYWTFDRPGVVWLNGTSCNSTNPEVMFTDGGPYTVTLRVQNNTATDMKTKVHYIWVGTEGLWCGLTSTDWNEQTNWDNWHIPVSSTDVVIPSAAPFWPTFTGNLMIGTTCNSVTLSNVNSQLTITGDLIIH